jgi:putative nucleotidyltransferase with HDIG domain
MNKALRYSLLMGSIITAINFVINALAISLNSLLFNRFWPQLITILFASAISAGIVTYFVVSVSPLVKEYINTFRRLLRLESLNHPLLVRFSHEAPGTYHHTLTMANIASRAAKAIGADSLLTRVGAYYHDIGKTNNSDHFVENQKNGNLHDNMNDPIKSAQIIINHVSEGVELAKEHHLPEDVVKFIRQHHGTTLVSYFYDQAKLKDENIKESDFRYPGPKPTSQETAIVMLADTIEAMVRAVPNPSPEDIRSIITKAIEQKTQDRQLEDSGLTASQIAKIRHSFFESLTAIYHQRIQYPDNKKTSRKK